MTAMPAPSERPIRRAAALIAGRDVPGGGLEVLVVERGAGSRFLPGYVAFPGGAVDDADAEAAARWFGDHREASRAAAVRELAEETAIDLAGIEAWALPELCHWVAPEDTPVRFDARYFGVDGAAAPAPVPDGGETAAAWWASPAGLLAGNDTGERKLYWPTWFTMQQLAMCSSVADLLALRFETRDPTDDEIADLPRWVMEDEP
jgi:8-oxo-dGTP pyrophosphatase MutT (NUDIX family)